ncbi:MAG: Histone family protein DNA-binding protein [uncultured bacterium]|nr:MAG: Histone family protein DNA-binding protein [uncultured bacterium]HBD05090.1 DNA-binding protein [Candidatus Uhrbacteria bacterium]
MAKMSKSQFVAEIAELSGKSKKESSEMWDGFVQMVYRQVKKDGEITLPGLGKFVKMRRNARMGRNPATGEQIKIAAKTVVKFRLAKQAKEAVL